MSAVQTICITGASSGIGMDTAKRLAKKGVHLILGARRVERLKTLREELNLRGCNVSIAPLDVKDPKSIDDFCSVVLDQTDGELDVLVNNAGLALGLSTVEDGDPQQWRDMFETNVLGLLGVSKRLLPALRKGRPGHLINIGSIAGHQVYERGAAYCGTKHALRAVTQTLRLELCGTGVRVTSIDPGMVQTEFSLVRLNDESKAKAVYDGLMPLIGKDIAECVEFVIGRPGHVNIDEIIVMPTDQASVYKVNRR